MKQKFLLKTMLLLCALMGGVSSVWAYDSTLTFTAACGGSGTADDGVEWTVTSDAAESTFDSGKGIHYGTGKVAVSYLSLKTSGISGRITQIVVNASGASGTTAKLNVTVGGDAFGSEQSLTASAYNYILTGNASGEIIVSVTQSSAKKALYVSSITVTYEIPVTGVSLASTLSVQEGSTETLTATVSPSNASNKSIIWSSDNTSIAIVSNAGVVTGVAGGTTTIWATSDDDNTKKASCTVTVTAASDTRTAVNLTGFSANQTTLAVGQTTNTTATNDQNGWTAAYTFESDNTDVATVDANGVITAVAKGSSTITCSLNVNPSDANYKAGLTNSMTVDITVTNPFHTATFSVNGNTSRTASVEQGELITFPPNIPDENGKKFMGWYTGAYTNATTAPTYVNTATTTMGDSDVTYYAVFATVSGSTTPANMVINTSTQNFPTSYGTANTFAEYTLNGKKFQIQQGYVNGTKLQWRASGHDSGTGTMYNSDAINKIQSIVLLYASEDGNKNFTVQVGTSANPTSSSAITPSISQENTSEYTFNSPSGDYDYFVLTNGSGAGYLTSITINYLEDNQTVSNYCTTVVVTYSVTYDGNGATSGSVPEDNTAYTSGQSVTVAGNTGNLAKTGYAFDGWNTQNDGQGTNYAANETFSITANTTLYAKWNEKTITGLSYTGTPAKTTYYAGESFDPTGLTVNVNYDDESSDDVTASVTWTPNPLTAGTTSVTGSYSGQTVNVSGLTVTAAPGTEANPYTVAQALNAINALDNNGTIDDKYVIGKVSTAGTSLSSGKMTYSISVDGTTTNQLQVYQGKSLGNGDFSAVTDLEVGDEVVVFGQLKKYVSGTKTTPEFNSGNYLISHTPKPASNLSKTSDITLDYKNADTMADLTDYYTTSSDGEISYTIGDGTVIERYEDIISALKVGETTVTVSQAATLSYKAGEITINVTVQDTREPATTIPGINISTLTVGAEKGTISVVDPVKADEGVTFSFASSNEDVLLIDGTDYVVGEIGTATVTVTATPSDANLYTPVEAEFTVTVEAASKTDTDIILHEESGSTEYGTPLVVGYAITNGYDGEMSYTIANPAIADVAIGVDAITFTPKAVGSTTITISAPATPSFNEADDVTFTLTVTAPIGGTEAYVSSATTASLSFASNDNWKLPTSSYVKTSASYSDGTYTISLSAGTAGDGWKWSQDATNGNYLIMGKTGVSLTLPAFDKAVTQIDVVGKTGASGYVVQNIYVGNTAVSTATTGATGTNEYAINENYQAAGTIYTLKVTSNHNTQITSIVVHFAANPITVTLAATGYATYCSPYPLDFSGNDHSKYRAWYVSSIDNTTVTFSEVTGLVKGGTPIILYGTPGAKCELASADSDNELDGNKLVGTLAPTWVVQESNGNINYALTTYGDFRKISTSGIVFPANKVYLPVPKAVAQGRSQLSIMFYDETTGISSMEDGRWLMNNAVYDLQGRRVETPRKGSLYILNGKKVVY